MLFVEGAQCKMHSDLSMMSNVLLLMAELRLMTKSKPHFLFSDFFLLYRVRQKGNLGAFP